MSFPGLHYGNYGDEKVAQSSKIGGLPLGCRMILPDGRVYVHAKASTAASIVVGVLCIQAATSSSAHAFDLAASAAASAEVINITLTATGAVTKNQFEDGYVWINDGAAAYGEGYLYKLKGNNSGAVSTTVEFQLADNEKIKVAVATGTAVCGIRVNEFKDVIIRATGTAAVGIPAGVTATAVSAGFYCWLQRRGPVSVLSGGTAAVTGERIAAETSVAGAICRLDPTTATTAGVGDAVFGRCMSPGQAAGDHELDYLTLE